MTCCEIDLFCFVLAQTATSLLAQALSKNTPRRPRGEKRPIPDSQKDSRYFERRKRNNLAAKKSRDQRKLREETVAMRAGLLEEENAALRAQLSHLQEEKNSLKAVLMTRSQMRANNQRDEFVQQLINRAKLASSSSAAAIPSHLGVDFPLDQVIDLSKRMTDEEDFRVDDDDIKCVTEAIKTATDENRNDLQSQDSCFTRNY